MSKGGLLYWVLLLEVCIAHQSLIWGSQLTAGGQIGDDELLFQDPIRRARLMSIDGRDELGDHSADSIFDDGVDTGDEYASINRGVPVAGGRVGDEEGQGFQPPYGDDDGGDSGAAKGSSSGSVDVECPECGKFFKNDKSMFGHLRSHPNRGYKGATPPVKKPKQSRDTTAAASASSSSPGTDRTPGQHSSHDPQLTPTSLEILCAYVLLTLKYRDSRPTTQVPQSTSSFGKLDAIGQAECGTGVSVTGNVAAELECNASAGAGNLENCDEHGYSTVKIPKKRRNMPKEVREAHRKKAKLLPTPKEKRPYACKHCKAEFPTNQALGGHVAGHHREKKVPRLNDPSAMAAESQNGKQQVKDDDDDNDKDLSLRRGLLSEQFSMALDVPWQSGQQAAGGKMRHHYGSRNDGLSMAGAAPTPTPVDDGGARRPWYIDLNVEAPEKE